MARVLLFLVLTLALNTSQANDIRTIGPDSSAEPVLAPDVPQEPLCVWPMECPAIATQRVRLNTVSFANEIDAASLRFGVDPAFIRTIIHVESAFKPKVVSHKGAQGLMQLMPATAKRFGVSNPFDPEQNIRGGTQYLGWLLQQFEDDWVLAAAAYNAGENAVIRHQGIPPYRETRKYIEKVQQLLPAYQDELVNRYSFAITSLPRVAEK